MKIGKYIYGIIVLLLVYGIYTYYKKTSIKNNNTFVVGIASGYAPFVSVNENGEYEGFDIDYAHSLAKEMNKILVLKDLGGMAGLFLALEQNKIDAIMWGLSITRKRLQKVDMIKYYGDETSSYELLFWDFIPNRINNIEDCAGKKIAVEGGSSQSAFLEKYAGINIQEVDKVDDALLSLQYGKVDAIFVEPVIAKKFTRKFPNIVALKVPLSDEDKVFGVGIVVKKGNDLLAGAITRAVKNSEQKGLTAVYKEKWGLI